MSTKALPRSRLLETVLYINVDNCDMVDATLRLSIDETCVYISLKFRCISPLSYLYVWCSSRNPCATACLVYFGILVCLALIMPFEYDAPLAGSSTNKRFMCVEVQVYFVVIISPQYDTSLVGSGANAHFRCIEAQIYFVRISSIEYDAPSGRFQH